jgi:hypothetical protein
MLILEVGVAPQQLHAVFLQVFTDKRLLDADNVLALGDQFLNREVLG